MTDQIPDEAVEEAARRLHDYECDYCNPPGGFYPPTSRCRVESLDRWQGKAKAILAAAAPIITAQATAPAPCMMSHQEPYDFAWCETHDTTFPLGDKCKFDGREPWQVYADEADEQRGLKVRAETELSDLRTRIEKLRDDMRTESKRLQSEWNDAYRFIWKCADALDALIVERAS